MITVRECTYDDRAKYDELEGRYHYMGESHGAGDTLRLIFEEDGEWVALQTWAAACYCLKPRDERIGWNPAMRASRLKLVANNRRFTLLAEKGARPNLASQVLGLAVRELPAMWEAKWGYRPLLAETFCDIERTAGTCYRAAGWEEVGKTKGFSRVRHARDFFVPNERPKVLFMKEFVRGAWGMIVSNDLPRECEGAAHSKADGVLPFTRTQTESLQWEMCHVDDPRKGNKSVGIGCLLTIYTMGVAAGARDLQAVVNFGKRLTNAQLGELGCPAAKDEFGEKIPGRYRLPSYTAFYYLLTHKDMDLDSYAERLSAWMEAQEGKLPRHLAIDGKFIREVTGLVSVVDAEDGRPVAVAPASRKKGLVGKCEMPVARKMLSRMDLAGAVVSADAEHCQDGTAQAVLERGGDYIFGVKDNRKDVEAAATAVCRARGFVDSFKKKRRTGTGTRNA